uniref:B30.2/SPRY domain-containing protein n=1 Tax=Cyprinodon variegatus TaxID=28743 RepID=A0A3Q2GG69_CYPVA
LCCYEPDTEPKIRAEFLKYSQQITLDPNTANIFLSLSEGNRKVTYMKQQSYLDHPERFTDEYQVLSRESLTGRCYWEVQCGGKGVYIAVSYKNIIRAGESNECAFGFNSNSWTIRNDTSRYLFYHNSHPVQGQVPSRIGVYLDHRAGILSFYRVSETLTLLHRVQTTFTQPLYAGIRLNYEGSSAEFLKPK